LGAGGVGRYPGRVRDLETSHVTLKLCPRCDARYRGDLATCPIDGAALHEPADPFLGRTIAGRYLIEAELGSGGMGTVYLARHQVIGRKVAMKFLDPALLRNERQRKRFLGEARAANQINHEHIIDITDFGETEDGLVYMVMEYLEGRPLSDDIAKGPLPPRRALRITLQVALGLARAHELGVVHRDVKPANIYLIRRKLDNDYVKILDFGVARIEQDARVTGQGTIVGTPEYIAPEQVRTPQASASGDLYSLGCVLFEMLTGRLPFEGKTTMLLVKHLNDPPPVPSSLLPSIPKAVDELVLCLLQKNPSDRFRDAYHLAEELQSLLDRLPPPSRHSAVVDPVSVEMEVAAEPLIAPSEDESFVKAVALYRTLLADAHPNGDAPAWLPESIAHLERAAAEIQQLRQHVRVAAEKATEQEEQLRAPRSQIGRALDELAQDESKLSRQIEALGTLLQSAETLLDAELGSLIERANIAPVGLVEGHLLSQQDAVLLTQTVALARNLAEVREQVATVRSDLAARELERKDLRFQITELKDQISTLHDASTMDQELVHDEVIRLGVEMRARLEAAAPYTARVAAHFSRFPALHERMRRRTGSTTDHDVV
jgi:eukaryotic-like serine/threonine-protein kinase